LLAESMPELKELLADSGVAEVLKTTADLMAAREAAARLAGEIALTEPALSGGGDAALDALCHPAATARAW
jgi:hypothetical protein